MNILWTCFHCSLLFGTKLPSLHPDCVRRDMCIEHGSVAKNRSCSVFISEKIFHYLVSYVKIRGIMDILVQIISGIRSFRLQWLVEEVFLPHLKLNSLLICNYSISKLHLWKTSTSYLIFWYSFFDSFDIIFAETNIQRWNRLLKMRQLTCPNEWNDIFSF